MQKLAQRRFLFNYVSTLNSTFEKKNTISRTYGSIFLFECWATFSKPVNCGLPVIL